MADRHIQDFMEADIIVFGFPLWNMIVPAVLHTFFDYLYRAGVTFKYTLN
ncbi:NAD(P)H-dependent oxidoreductase [Peribacillus sp. AS_2]